MMKILNVEPENYSQEARRLLESIAIVHERKYTRRQLIAHLPMYDILIVRLKHQINQEVIDVGQQLKAIVTATTGLDHIDIDYAKSRGISVLSLRGETDFLRTVTATAEHTWALLLSLLRKIPESSRSAILGRWDRDAFRGQDLYGKRLGIVGLGRIGEMVARYGFSFGMEVHAYDPYKIQWPTGVIIEKTLRDLLINSDVLSLHVPLNNETFGMISLDQIDLLPKGAIILNTSRGDLIESRALIDRLKNGQLSGAALDVIPGERAPQKPERLILIEYACKHSNLLLTPHIAGATVQSMAKTEMFMATKLLTWIKSNQFSS